MESVHGHELINLIAQANKPLTIEEIKEMAQTKIGNDIRYYTCSDSSMDLDEMINFLLVREKLIRKNEGYMINFGNVCDHD